jgi:hypothetical protein
VPYRVRSGRFMWHRTLARLILATIPVRGDDIKLWMAWLRFGHTASTVRPKTIRRPSPRSLAGCRPATTLAGARAVQQWERTWGPLYTDTQRGYRLHIRVGSTNGLVNKRDYSSLVAIEDCGDGDRGENRPTIKVRKRSVACDAGSAKPSRRRADEAVGPPGRTVRIRMQ